MTTKEEILNQYDDEILKDVFTSGWIYGDDKEIWKHIENDNTDYDEGTVTTSYIVQHVPTGRYFQYDHMWNSWADYDEDFDKGNIIEVEPKEVTVTQYVPIQNS